MLKQFFESLDKLKDEEKRKSDIAKPDIAKPDIAKQKKEIYADIVEGSYILMSIISICSSPLVRVWIWTKMMEEKAKKEAIEKLITVIELLKDRQLSHGSKKNIKNNKKT